MFFEAQLKGKTHFIDVQETHRIWKIGLKEEGEDWHFYEISKKEFRFMDDAISFLFERSSYMIDVVGSGTEFTVYTRGSYRTIPIFNDESLLHESLKGAGGLGNDDSLVAGMPGKVVKVHVEPGQKVKANEPILVIEAMKMENEMRASSDVTIKSVEVSENQNVESGCVLVTFD